MSYFRNLLVAFPGATQVQNRCTQCTQCML